LNPLVDAGIGILTISTFDTDYVLVRNATLERASAVLCRHFKLIDGPAETVKSVSPSTET
jgi:hypothetical protein